MELTPVGAVGPTLSDSERTHLLEEAEELYWNELEWERLTDEEKLDDGPIATLMFPGFLAFVRGLLVSEAMPDALAPADPRPEVVEAIVRFLGERVVALEAETEDQGAPMDAEMTGQLIDHVLFRLHGLSDEDVARVEGQSGR